MNGAVITPDISYHGPVVVFDLDDTLVRERNFCRSGFRFLCDPTAYRVLPLDPYPSEKTLSELAREMDIELTARRNPFVPFENFFKPLAEKEHMKWDLQMHIDAYRNHTPSNLNFIPGAGEVVSEMATLGVKMALVTDGRSGTQRKKIEGVGLDRFISPELILISEETGKDKGSNDMFVSVVRAFPEAREFFYVADNSLKDFYHPNLLGWTTIKVPPDEDNVHPESEPPSPLHKAQIYLTDYLQLTTIIRKCLQDLKY